MSLQVQEDFGMCPSFNSYSTGTTVDAAIRAGGCSFLDFNGSHSPNKPNPQEDNDDDDFEFVSLQKPTDCDDVFSGGLIAPVFPIFNSDLLLEEFQVEKPEIDCRDSAIVQPIQIPLEKLLIRDRDNDPQSLSSSSSSSSSSSVDELEGVPSETYCVWKPKSTGTPNLACKKSRSTGSSSSKRWGIRDLLRRSHSDGKHSYISFSTPSTSSNSTKKKSKEIKSETKSRKELKKKDKSSGNQKKIYSAHESFYVRNRALKEEGKRKSYLPYKLQAGIGWLLE